MGWVWHEDVGHAWLFVPWSAFLLTSFEPSAYSYADARGIYLEEDCDAPGFLREYPLTPPPIGRAYEDNSRVRRLDRASGWVAFRRR